ncbi:MAG TPA: glycine cleavage system protein H, partial [Thermoanaerobaculia bacterium]
MHTDPPPGCLPCIWMTAGLVSYRLCDREHDCDRCPFDAALRGVEPEPAAAAPPGRDRGPAAAGRGAFPEDRRYGDGHTWVQPAGDAAAGRFRLGLDGFAASLLAPPRALRCRAPGRRLAAGEAFCELDMAGGELTLGAPLAGEVAVANAACSADPTLPLASPYGDGWLVELTAAPGAEGGEGLRTAA